MRAITSPLAPLSGGMEVLSSAYDYPQKRGGQCQTEIVRVAIEAGMPLLRWAGRVGSFVETRVIVSLYEGREFRLLPLACWANAGLSRASSFQ